MVVGKKKTNFKPAPSLPPSPGLTSLQTPLIPFKRHKEVRGSGGYGRYIVFALWHSFHLTLFLCSSVGSSWAPPVSGRSICSGTDAPQAAVDTYSTMEHLLLLLTLVLPLLFPPLFLSLCSLLLYSFSIFSPLSVFTEVPPCWLGSCVLRQVHWNQPCLARATLGFFSQRPPLQLPCNQSLTTCTQYGFPVLLASRPSLSMKVFTEV